ncbi:uncharacterized protein [Dysidea avara]|uniref:uncharacterized protein n=1 Tax=Dysidea avara TaxID=196820 RepID=UPI0033278787
MAHANTSAHTAHTHKSTTGSDIPPTYHFGARLPKLEIPVFSGEPLDWQPFWDCFAAAIDTNPSLSGVQKLSYLRAQLRGEASRVITGLPLTNLNYNHSVTLLKERYGQSQKIISAHIQALLDLPKPSNKLASLRFFHDTVETHVRCLESLGKSPESLDTLLAPMILTKLPEETRRNMARGHTSAEWTVLEIQTAICNEIRIFETGQQISASQQGNPTVSFHTSLHRKPQLKRETSNKLSCVYCKGNHAAINCEVHKEAASRIEIIRQQRLCYNCLAHHRVSQCHSKNRCRKCGNKHHTSICSDPSKQTTSETSTSSDVAPVSTTATTDTASLTTLAPRQLTKSTTCLLKTAIVTVVGTSLQTEANVLFDEGSQRSFLTEKLANDLELTPYRFENISLSSFGANKPLHKQMNTVSIRIRTPTGEMVPLSALVVPTIATPISNPLHTDVLQLPHLKGLPLAHPVTAAENFEISLLIGADHYWDLVGDHIVRGAGPTAMSSKLGYLLSGLALLPRPPSASVNSLHVITGHHQEECDLLRFWQIEDTAITQTEPDQSDARFLQSYFVSHISRLTDGTYCAGFPWRGEHPPLPDNLEVCQRRTRSLAHRLAKSPGLLQTYDGILKEQLNRGFIELVTEADKSSPSHYIPHHPVRKDSATTPIRIVYDCSCRQSREHPSLNDCLLTGPPFLNDLTSIVLRFRIHLYGISTDIEKAFLHIALHEKDRNFTRFLWLSDPCDPNSEFNIYHFRTVLFGSVSSPFMLFATLNYHLLQHDTHTSHNIRHNLYVDNVVTGCNTEREAAQFYRDARSMLSDAKFNLRAWASNSEQLVEMSRQDGTLDSSNLTNVLGLQWDTTADKLSLSLKGLGHPTTLTTKREVLKDASKLFDPLGITSPVSVRAKIFMQKLWQLRVEWDEPLDATIRDEWITIISDIQKLSELIIDRCYFKEGFHRADVNLHVFADASMKAYGAVAFLVSDNNVSLTMAKNRVAPLKSLTLPKLELMAAVIASRVAKFVSDSLELENTPTYYWGDSQIVLHWLASTKPLPQFVQHRVAEIRAAIPGSTWHFCPTTDNPADLLTRGISFQSLSSTDSLWWKGPPWLTTPNAWPTWQMEPAIQLHAAAAIAEEFVPQRPTNQDTGLHQIIKLSNYSSLNKLLAITAYTTRFVNNLCRSRPKLNGPLTAEELSSARIQWIQACQELRYPLEMVSAKSKCTRPEVKKLPLVRQLRLFVDDRGLLRCGGRIHNAPLSELARFPYLLPQNDHFTARIVYNTHVFLSHAGVGSTLTALRQTFWIPSGRQYVKKLLRQCTVCR